MLLSMLMRGGAGQAAGAAAALRGYSIASGDALAGLRADQLLRRILLLLGKKDAPARRQAEGWAQLTRLPWAALSAGVEAARLRVDILRLHREAHIAGASPRCGQRPPHQEGSTERACQRIGGTACAAGGKRSQQHVDVVLLAFRDATAGLAAEVARSEQEGVAAQVAAAAGGDVPGACLRARACACVLSYGLSYRLRMGDRGHVPAQAADGSPGLACPARVCAWLRLSPPTMSAQLLGGWPDDDRCCRHCGQSDG